MAVKIDSQKQAGEKRYDPAEVFDDHSDRESNKRRNNRRLYGRFILLDVIAIFAGMILCSFGKALGFGGFLFGAILLLLGVSFTLILKKL